MIASKNKLAECSTRVLWKVTSFPNLTTEKVNANEHNNKGRSIILDRWKADVKLCGLKTESDPMKGETDIDTS